MKMAEAHSDKTGITLEAFTTCCGIQLYAGNFITPQKGKDGASYSERDGFCLEAQFYPNAISRKFCKPDFKRPGALQLDDQLPFFLCSERIFRVCEKRARRNQNGSLLFFGIVDENQEKPV